MTANKRNKSSDQSDDVDPSKPDGCQPTPKQAEADPLRPYDKKISEGIDNLRGRESWFRQRSGNRSK